MIRSILKHGGYLKKVGLLASSRPLCSTLKNNSFYNNNFSSSVIGNTSSINHGKLFSTLNIDSSMSYFSSENKIYPKIKLDKGRIAEFISDKEPANEKDIEDLKNALNFVLKEKVLFEESSSGLYQAKLPNNIRIEFYSGGMDENAALIAIRDESSLYYEYIGDWLDNWDMKTNF